MESLPLNKIDTSSSPSPEMFSFPGTPADDQSEFEFGSCVTPDSPTTASSEVTKNNLSVDDLSTTNTSPADQFFLNGRLLPHDFPVVQTSSSSRASFSGRENMGPAAAVTLSLSRGTSAGSVSSGSSSQHCSSKDYSLVSSRSNSTNSSGGSTYSTCASTNSTARTSSSEVNSERKMLQKRMHSVKEKSVSSSSSPLGKYYKFGTSGSSQRWQFITAIPVLGPSQSRRGRRENGGGTGTSPTMMRDVGSKGKRGGDHNNNNNNNNNNNGHGSLLYKMLRSVVATCKACHAMEGQEKEFELDIANDHVLGH